MTIVDAYAHVGLPRFQSASDYESVMSAAGIGRAVLVGFNSSPDAQELHGAIARRPDVFCAIGFPVGRDRARMETAARAQLAAGFGGLRLSEDDVLHRPWLLDVIGEAHGVAIVCGGRISTAEVAVPLLAHLERHPEVVVVGGHFAGPRHPDALETGAVAELFDHPRFLVIFSRHGGYPARQLEPWAHALVEQVGWDRLMWGSEAPVSFWRNETIESTLAWVDRLSPTESERAAYLGENAQRVFFESVPSLGEFQLPFDPWEDAEVIPAHLWANGLDIDQDLAGRLVHAWLSTEATRRGPLGNYLEKLLDAELPPASDATRRIPRPRSTDLKGEDLNDRE